MFGKPAGAPAAAQPAVKLIFPDMHVFFAVPVIITQLILTSFVLGRRKKACV
jgi:hypothetical protein